MPFAIYKRNRVGELPWQFKPIPDEDAAQLVAPQLSPRDVDDLVREGIWVAQGHDGSENNWLRPGPEGEWWAGCHEGPGALVARVRGKRGRRTSMRPSIHKKDKLITCSIILPPEDVEWLDARAAQLGERKGVKMNKSNIVQQLVAAERARVAVAEA